MNKSGKAYEPPMAKVYRFDDNEHILTASGGTGGGGGTTPDPAGPNANYAANALNELFGGTNTTIEQK